jgi:prevent-host-death family protein
MVSVKVEELQASLGRYLDHMNAGEEVVVTDHGRAVARLVPYVQHPTVVTVAADEDLVATQVLCRAQRELPSDFWSQPRVLDPNGLFRRAALEEREQSW